MLELPMKPRKLKEARLRVFFPPATVHGSAALQGRKARCRLGTAHSWSLSKQAKQRPLLKEM